MRKSKRPAEYFGIEKTFLKCRDQNYIIQRLCLCVSGHMLPYVQSQVEKELVQYVIWRPGLPD